MIPRLRDKDFRMVWLRDTDDQRYRLRETEKLTIAGRSMRLQWKVTNARLVKNQGPK